MQKAAEEAYQTLLGGGLVDTAVVNLSHSKSSVALVAFFSTFAYARRVVEQFERSRSIKISGLG